MVFFILGILIFTGAFAFLITKVRKLAKAISIELFNIKKELITFALLSVAMGIGIFLFFLGMPDVWKDPEFFKWENITAGERVLSFFGGLITGFSIGFGYTSFRLHYYQKLLSKKLDKWLFRSFLASFLVFAIGIWVLSEGTAHHIVYPLINGISFDGGFHFVKSTTGKANIAWYAICILTGAIYCYFIADHLLFEKTGKHGLLESTFFIAFPAGIIGARIFYVIGNWEREFASQPFWKVFAIWEGGLTILGGAVFGIIIGILWFKWRHPKTNLFMVIDFAVASILFAQAIGRWGNFFNCEVHGNAMPLGFYNILPTFIKEQCRFSSTDVLLESGMIYNPLFLIESLTNLLGFFVLDFVVLRFIPKGVHKDGDNFGLYLIWYGLTRTIMEPLRTASYNMGVDGKWSWIWSILFVTFGLLFILGNHIIRFFINQKKKKEPIRSDTKLHSFVSIPLILFVGLFMFICGLILMTSFAPPTDNLIAYSNHNLGIIFTIIGASLIPLVCMPIIKLVFYKKQTNILNKS